MKDSMYSAYNTPFRERYASKEMLALFSPDKKFSTWRRLWIALAEAEQELGLSITDEQIEQMKANILPVDYDFAGGMEKKFRHDVMAHVHTYGFVAPKAMPIIHLGATSCFVSDNADILIMREALTLIYDKILNVLAQLRGLALKYKDMPTLGFTHFQPAQLTTVGKRVSLWMYDLLTDLDNIEFTINSLTLLGAKGATGTQASFMYLFDNDHDKVKRLDLLVAEKIGFPKVQPVTGQTYSRKQDSRVLAALAGVAESAHKFANDLRLLASLKETEEPFESTQIGSSAMAYKRNPMRSERVCSIARYVISLSANPYYTHSVQWLERTLDDSANRRMCIPEAFLGIDSILELLINITDGMVIYDKIIAKRINDELPFMATENIIMEAVRQGADRQEMHERIRIHSMEAGKRVKQEGLENNMMELMADDNKIPLNKEQILTLLNPKNYVGRAPEQTAEFISEYIDPILQKYKDVLGKSAEIKV
ncbi:MAG: adenylosuccinate lyase [Deferribacteraceae bacterium]|jgi:adenylosuccinate lyase|nr:adenylosuccinate lyase [Deferribacteraceae bacterium]